MVKHIPVALALALVPIGCAGAEPTPATPGASGGKGAQAPQSAQAAKPAQGAEAVPTVAIPAPSASAAPGDADDDGEGQRAKGDEGEPATGKDVAKAGIIGLLNTTANDPNAPTAPWGRDDSLGNDPLTAKGNMWGNDIGKAFGAGGLGLVGTGKGGGGSGEGTIGLGSIGTIGHGAGTGTGQGFGSGSGRLGSSSGKKPPSIKIGAATVGQGLPPEVILRIVRQNFGRFRLCYEKGLQKKADLAGQITVKFTIQKDGSAGGATGSGSTLSDKDVVACVVKSFDGLSFPETEGQAVHVTYPLTFKPGEDPPATPAAPAKPAAPASPAKPAASAPAAPAPSAPAAPAPAPAKKP